MMIIDYILNADWFEIIGFGLLHASWLIIVYSIITGLLLKSIKKSKYKATALLGALSLSIITFVLLICYKLLSFETFAGEQISQSIFIHAQSQTMSNEFNLLHWIQSHKVILITTWLIGSIVLLCRYLISYGYLVYIKNSVTLETSKEINKIVDQLSISLNYSKRKIKLGYSALVNSPIIIGWIKPVIIFPIGLINLLDEDEVKSIVAHEISHLLRNDQLINFLMSALEIIFYYHPCVWWMNSNMKKYREEACDDQAIAVLSDKMTYIKTLVKLQELRLSSNPHLSIAITNNESNFYQRIKRLLNMDIQSKNLKTQFLVISSVLLIGLMITQSTLNAMNTPSQEDGIEIHLEEEEIDYIIESAPTEDVVPLNYQFSSIDTIPNKKTKKKSKSQTTIIKNDGNESVTLEMENGEIKRLEVDGKEIPEEDYDKYTNENLDITKLGNLDGMNMYFLQDEDGEINFPDHLNNIEIFEGFENFPKNFRIDSLINLNSDSIFAFSFGDDFPHRFEHNLDQYEDIFEKFGDQHEMFENQNELFEELREKGLFKDGENGVYKWFGFGDDDRLEWHHDHDRLGGDQLRFYFDDDKGDFRDNRTLEDLIGHQLNKDGFLLPNKENKVLLTGKYLKINGEKQPSNIWNKYKSIFETETGVPLSRKSRLEFSIIGKDYGKRYKAF